MKRNPALISIVLTMLALVAVFGIAQQGVPRVVATNLENLPKVIDRYIGFGRPLLPGRL